jgi:predicted nucleic-acid-binding Zn-ribbon protein
MGLLEAFNRGLSGDDSYEIAGIQVECAHCGGNAFDERSAQLNTAGATFVGLDWANKNATVLVCQNCGHLEWFL